MLAKNLEEELEGAADLFAPLPPTEDCAICLVPFSPASSESCYHACCGNSVCLACRMENKASVDKQNEAKSAGKKLALACPFCRELVPTNMGYLHQLQARCLQNDHVAFTLLGHRYQRGELGTPKDDLKALDCYIRAVELGSLDACNQIGIMYVDGNGVAIDKKRAALFERVGALRGDIAARHNIGYSEYNNFGNHEIGIRHWKVAAEAGYQRSLDCLKGIYNADGKLPGKEFISKDDMDTVYRVCHEAQMEVKTDEREKHSGAK